MERRPSISESGGTRVPIIEDQIRGYRRMQQTRKNLAKQIKRTTGGQRSLETQLDPDQQLELSRGQRASLVPAETLYNSGWKEGKHRVYQHYTEERILCIGEGAQEERSFINKISFERLKKEGLEHIHLGMILVRIHTLHRREAGTMALVVVRDTRWKDDRAIIGSMEVDLSTGTQLVYLTPDMMMSINDFFNHIELVVQTRGYENWVAADSNLLITRGLVARLTNTSFANFKYSVDNVVDYLSSSGIKAISGQKQTTDMLQGLNWVVKPKEELENKIPSKAKMANRSDGSIAMRFSKYEKQRIKGKHSVNEDDIENINEEFAAVIIGEDEEKDEVWDTLGQPAGRFNYYVRYSAPASSRIRFEDIVPTGWGDELGEENAPSPKQSKEGQNDEWKNRYRDQDSSEKDDSDDSDTESIGSEGEWYEQRYSAGPKVGEESEEEYDPIAEMDYWYWQANPWDNSHEELPPEWEDFHDSDRGLMAKEEEVTEEDLLPYQHILKLKRRAQENAYTPKENAYSLSEVTSPYRAPPEAVMGPANYPPANAAPTASTINPIYDASTSGGNIKFNFRKPQDGAWVLPNAQQSQGAILVLPRDISLFGEVIDRWESITINFINSKAWESNQAKVDYIENLLGEYEKKMFIQWRMAYPSDYQGLIGIAEDVRNVVYQIRRIITLEDPYQGSTDEQNRAYVEIERLTCNDPKYIPQYLDEYWKLATKTGRAYINSELSEKIFRKMPPIIGRELEEAYKVKYPGNTVGVLPRVVFAQQYLTELCKKAALQKAVRDMSFCSKIPLPGYYQKQPMKRFGIRKAKTYKGKPHESHIRVFRRKDGDRQTKCKCYICGEEGHFARECRQKRGDIARKAIMEGINLPDDWDVLSVDLNEPDDDAICSVSEGEEEQTAHALSFGAYPYEEETAFMIDCTEERPAWMVDIKLPKEKAKCEHDWEENSEVNWTDIKCNWCKMYTNQKMRIHCKKCKATACPTCSKYYCGKKIEVAPVIRTETTSENTRIQALEKENIALKHEVEKIQFELELVKEENRELRGQLMVDKLQKDLEELPPVANEKGKGIDYSEELIAFIEEEPEFDEFDPGNSNKRGRVIQRKPERRIHQLYRFQVEFIIPGIRKFSLVAIVDTGTTTSCANEYSLPPEALELTQSTKFLGVNSSNISNHKVKQGKMLIGEQKFNIPLIKTFHMSTWTSGIDILLGWNFITEIRGGIKIEENRITFIKETEIQGVTVGPDQSLKDKLLNEPPMDSNASLKHNPYNKAQTPYSMGNIRMDAPKPLEYIPLPKTQRITTSAQWRAHMFNVEKHERAFILSNLPSKGCLQNYEEIQRRRRMVRYKGGITKKVNDEVDETLKVFIKYCLEYVVRSLKEVGNMLTAEVTEAQMHANTSKVGNRFHNAVHNSVEIYKIGQQLAEIKERLNQESGD